MSSINFSNDSSKSLPAAAPSIQPVPDANGNNACSLKKDLAISLLQTASRMDRLALVVARIGLVLVLVWIGGLKIFAYEAEGIVPFVANSPLMKFFYKYQAPAYADHMNDPGAVVPANRTWHEQNHTYIFAYGLGAAIVAFGVMIALHPWFPSVAALGGFLTFLMSFVTLSFLITTPEAWVQPHGSPHYGFPLLALPGLLVVKDSIMMGAALVVMADSAKASLRRTNSG
jgi:reactive chlorine resistance protein C